MGTERGPSLGTDMIEPDAFIKLFELRGVREIIIMDGTGKPLRSTVSQRRTLIYASQLFPLATMARNVVRDLDPANEVTFMRIRSESMEVHMTPHPDFTIVVIQRLKARKST